MKKLFSLILVLCLLLAGCGGRGSKNKIKVGVLFNAYTHTVQQESLLASLDEAGYLGVPMSVNGDHNLQKTYLSGLMDQKFPLIIIEPADPEKSGELAAILKDADVPGIFIGQEPASEILDSWDKLFYVGVDETLQGYLQGQMIANSMDGGDINGDGVVSYAIISCPEGELITEYCDDALNGNLLEICVSTGDREDSRQVSRDLMNRFGKDVEVLLCNSDEMALGVVQSVMAGGWTPGQDIYVVGVGGTEEMLNLIDKGTCFGTVIPDETVRAQQIAKIAAALLTGSEAEKRFYAGYTSVTAENIAIFVD